MMTNSEILKEVKSTFNLEGVKISNEQENRILDCLSGKVSFEDMKQKISDKYSELALNE